MLTCLSRNDHMGEAEEMKQALLVWQSCVRG